MRRPRGRACGPLPEPRPSPARRSGLPTLAMIANRRRPGTTSRKSSSRLPARSVDWIDRPVTLPPGRARLATRPVPTGSAAIAKTIGMTDVACFAAMTAAVPAVTMTSTLSRTNSAAISAKRSLRPSAQRYSIATVRPSIQPSSRSRCTKAAVHWLWVGRRARAQEPDGRQLRRLLRARRERPRRRRAAEQRDELAPSHSITSSARSTRPAGSSCPIALAALRLMTSSKRVGCSTGMSAGLRRAKS